jgi:hypothetical protein
MKMFWNRLAVIAALGSATIGFWAAPASAQNGRTMAQGHFTLPYEVHWKSTVLPAGDYTFRLQGTSSWTIVGLQGPNGETRIMALAIDTEASKESSKLKIDHRDGIDYVQDLYVAEAGLHVRYEEPKPSKSERLLAKRQPSTPDRTTVALSDDNK